MFIRVYSEYLTKREFIITAQASSQRAMDFKDYFTFQQDNIYALLLKNE